MPVCGRLSRFESGEQSLVNGKIAACAPNGFAHSIRNDEFEAVAKSVFLAHGRTVAQTVTGPSGSVKLNSTISPTDTSIVSMAAIPDSLMSTLRPFSTPQVRDLIVMSVSILNRGFHRSSAIVRSVSAAY
jgi:hypothetical protein